MTIPPDRRAGIFAAVLLLANTPFQDSTGSNIKQLIDRLGAEDIRRRHEASNGLKTLGQKAVPELEKATQSADKEVAARAREILHWIGIEGMLAPSLKAVFPGAVDRLSQGEDHEWTRILLHALMIKYGIRGAKGEYEKNDLLGLSMIISENIVLKRDRTDQLTITDDDLCFLVVPAIRAAKDEREKAVICIFAAKARHVKAAPDLRSLLRDKSGLVRMEAAQSLGNLGVEDAVEEIMELLSDSDRRVRYGALVSLSKLRAKKAIPQLPTLLEDEEYPVRYAALELAITLKAKEILPSLLRRFKDPQVGYLLESTETWNRMGGGELTPELDVLLKHTDPSVRAGAQRAIDLIRQASNLNKTTSPDR